MATYSATEKELRDSGFSPTRARNLANKINSLNPSIRERYAETVKDFQRKYGSQGYEIDINQAHRTPAEQRRIQATGVKAASPKNTWHTVGGATDFTIYKDGKADPGTSGKNAYATLLAPIAKQHSLHNPIRNDVGHFQPIEFTLARRGATVESFITPQTDVSPLGSRTLRPGMSGPDIKALQTALKNAGFDPGAINGDFNDATRAALTNYQTARGITADGEVGRDTRPLLANELRPRSGIGADFLADRTPRGQQLPSYTDALKARATAIAPTGIGSDRARSPDAGLSPLPSRDVASTIGSKYAPYDPTRERPNMSPVRPSAADRAWSAPRPSAGMFSPLPGQRGIGSDYARDPTVIPQAIKRAFDNVAGDPDIRPPPASSLYSRPSGQARMSSTPVPKVVDDPPTRLTGPNRHDNFAPPHIGPRPNRPADNSPTFADRVAEWRREQGAATNTRIGMDRAAATRDAQGYGTAKAADAPGSALKLATERAAAARGASGQPRPQSAPFTVAGRPTPSRSSGGGIGSDMVASRSAPSSVATSSTPKQISRTPTSVAAQYTRPSAAAGASVSKVSSAGTPKPGTLQAYAASIAHPAQKFTSLTDYSDMAASLAGMAPTSAPSAMATPAAPGLYATAPVPQPKLPPLSPPTTVASLPAFTLQTASDFTRLAGGANGGFMASGPSGGFYVQNSDRVQPGSKATYGRTQSDGSVRGTTSSGGGWSSSGGGATVSAGGRTYSRNSRGGYSLNVGRK